MTTHESATTVKNSADPAAAAAAAAAADTSDDAATGTRTGATGGGGAELPRPVVVCGPSGSGKSTLINMLLKQHPGRFAYSVSHTTRKPRPGEVDGTDYHFCKSREDFDKLVSDKAFIEHAEYAGNCYGTSYAAVESVQEDGRCCLLDIDLQGVRQVQGSDRLPVRVCFLQPPSLEVLETRLTARGEELESRKRRLSWAAKELEAAKEPGLADFVLVNDNLQEAYKRFEEWILKDNA